MYCGCVYRDSCLNWDKGGTSAGKGATRAGPGWGTAMTARPERVAAEEVRQRMLDAGRELALEAGAALTIEHLRLEEVIQRARVPRSSVYRMWPYKENYIDDLLCYLAGEGNWFSERGILDPE